MASAVIDHFDSPRVAFAVVKLDVLSVNRTGKLSVLLLLLLLLRYNVSTSISRITYTFGSSAPRVAVFSRFRTPLVHK